MTWRRQSLRHKKAAEKGWRKRRLKKVGKRVIIYAGRKAVTS